MEKDEGSEHAAPGQPEARLFIDQLMHARVLLAGMLVNSPRSKFQAAVVNESSRRRRRMAVVMFTEHGKVCYSDSIAVEQYTR